MIQEADHMGSGGNSRAGLGFVLDGDAPKPTDLEDDGGAK